MNPEDIKRFGQMLQTAKPYLFTIDQEATKLQNGCITFEVRVFNGFVTDVIVTTARRHKFKNPLDKSK